MITQLAVGGFDNNFSYFICDKESREIVIVDPTGDIEEMIQKIHTGNFVPKAILITHSHFDHVDGVPRIVEKFDIPVYMHKNAQGRVGIPDEVSRYTQEGDTIQIKGVTLTVMYTPGHIDDSVCYYIDKKYTYDDVPKLITGDTLFVEGCGRADFKESSVEDLYKSLERIKRLSNNTEIYSGHDYGSKPVSNIAWEKQYNKYFLCKNFKEFREKRIS